MPSLRPSLAIYYICTLINHVRIHPWVWRKMCAQLSVCHALGMLLLPRLLLYHVHVSRATPFICFIKLVLQTNANNGNRGKVWHLCVRKRHTPIFNHSQYARSVIPKTQPVETSGTQIKVITISLISDSIREFYFAFVLWWCEKCVWAGNHWNREIEKKKWEMILIATQCIHIA